MIQKYQALKSDSDSPANNLARKTRNQSNNLRNTKTEIWLTFNGLWSCSCDRIPYDKALKLPESVRFHYFSFYADWKKGVLLFGVVEKSVLGGAFNTLLDSGVSDQSE